MVSKHARTAGIRFLEEYERLCKTFTSTETFYESRPLEQQIVL